MRLEDLQISILDLQTTGMRPPLGSVLEVAWAQASARSESLSMTSHLMRQAQDQPLSPRIQSLTGISPSEMANAVPGKQIRDEILGSILPFTLIHYAQFEKPFLKELFQPAEFPSQIICTHQVARRLVPNLPTKGVRGLAGYFGTPIEGELKRAGSHVQATWIIWRGLVERLSHVGIEDLKSLLGWLDEPTKTKRARYEYPLEARRRLQLPDCPGVYRMLAKNQHVLYVGKATSLKSRVNSYFRGQKGRDRQKLEMLTQVWDIAVSQCATPLEAALLETDEIKRLDPPYNISLKLRSRQLVFYNPEFTSHSFAHDADHKVGPFSSRDVMAQLVLLAASLAEHAMKPEIFYNPLQLRDLEAGLRIYCTRQCWPEWPQWSARQLLVHAMWKFREFLRSNPEPEDVTEDATEEENDLPPTPDEIADKFERLMLRAAGAYHRSRTLTRLLNADIEFSDHSPARRLYIRQGQVSPTQDLAPHTRSWATLDVQTYDRMRVLLTELTRVQAQAGMMQLSFR